MKNKFLLLLFASIASISAFFIYLNIFHLKWDQAFYYALAIFSLDVKTPNDFNIINIPAHWHMIYFSGVFAIIAMFGTVFALYYKYFIQEDRRKKIIKNGKHIIVIGLGDSNRVYIDSELSNGNKEIIIVEHDHNNMYIEKYKQSLAVIVGDGKDLGLLKNLNVGEAKHIVISTANDMINLEIATQLLSLNATKNMFVHIEDRNLRYFHKTNGILSDSNVKVYSYYEEAARELFSNYDIDGEDNSIISSSRAYAIAVVGNTRLSYEVIIQACMMGQLPNENLLTIYCIDKDVKKFKEDIELYFPEIVQVPNVVFKYVELDIQTKMFYRHYVWNNEMTNIILCFEEDQKNLDIAANFLNITFSNKLADNEMNTYILLAMFSNYNLNCMIKNNHQVFKYLFSFGNINDINESEYVISSQRDKIAIAADFIYNNIEPKIENYDKYEYTYKLYIDDEDDKKDKEKLSVKEKIEKEKNNEIVNVYNDTGYIETNDNDWQKLAYFKKESNRAVADQIKMKLKYLGLKIVKSDNEDKQVLFESNKILFNPSSEDKFLLAKMEHNRWNAFHYANGYKRINFVSIKDKKNLEFIHETKKHHMCLVSFSYFKKKKDRLSYLGYKLGKFEGYDFMINEHIPLILANAGYAIKVPIKLGVTGHRECLTYIRQIVKHGLENIQEKYIFEEIISPLADGADRIVAKVLMDNYDAKLIVPLPFEKDEYKKDFSEESQKEFDEYLGKASSVYMVDSLDNNSRETCYLHAGQEVVDQCDVLIALWDGKPAKGEGGTGDIVAYAKKKDVKIVHIDTHTLNINYINF